ncbi:hypothetical protein BJ994_000734 [Arthrobacter pigmenti]|uniref:Uncharacterized protein n=1 Tax=Arthrobacter pigmenti TaxID=271432 RepID=A0A846RET6_9MICC|nr:hypothetical protein [Arthrobacter pigmenti]NJC21658.1 hypothetical protein [Arthrobacter pigmenti]
MTQPGPSAPPKQPKQPESNNSTRTLLRVFMLLLLGTLLASNFPLPWKVLGLIFGLASVTVGVLALVGLVKQKAPAVLRVSTTVGLVASLFLTLGLGAAILLWPVTERYEDCTSRALTSQAQRECEDGLRNLDGFFNQ